MVNDLGKFLQIDFAAPWTLTYTTDSTPLTTMTGATLESYTDDGEEEKKPPAPPMPVALKFQETKSQEYYGLGADVIVSYGDKPIGFKAGGGQQGSEKPEPTDEEVLAGLERELGRLERLRAQGQLNATQENALLVMSNHANSLRGEQKKKSLSHMPPARSKGEQLAHELWNGPSATETGLKAVVNQGWKSVSVRRSPSLRDGFWHPAMGKQL